MNAYGDCWFVRHARGAITEVSANRNVHEVLFIANDKSGMRMTQIVSVFRSAWVGQRHRRRDAAVAR